MMTRRSTTATDAAPMLTDVGEPHPAALTPVHLTRPILRFARPPLAASLRRRHLALSTNNIKNIACTKGLDSITTLSLSRNMITKIENMNDIADTLEQLWLSYNQVEKLSGVERLEHLRVLFLSNNKVMPSRAQLPGNADSFRLRCAPRRER